MRQLDRRRGSAHHDMLVAPVKLRHITGRKEQRHKRLRARGPTGFNLPLPHMTLNAVIGTAIPLGLKAFEQPSRCAPPRFGQKSITAQPLIQTAAPRPKLGPKLGPGLRLALVNRLRPILQIFANRSAIARTNGALASLRDNCRDRAKPLILSPSRNPRRLIFPIVSTHSTPAAPAQKRDCCTTGVVGFARCSTPSAGHFCMLFYMTLRRISIEAAADVTADRLIAALARLGYEAHELDPGLLSATQTDRQGQGLLLRLGVAGFAMMNVMLFSVAVWSGAPEATRNMFHWISAIIALPTVAFAGQPFFRSAWASLRARRLGMDVPISLALILASGISLFETVMGGSQAYFDAAVSLTLFLLAGRYLDHRTRAVARSAAEELAALEVPRATVLRHGVELLLPLAEVLAGDIVRVRPGGRMPVDGVVLEGARPATPAWPNAPRGFIRLWYISCRSVPSATGCGRPAAICALPSTSRRLC